MGENKNKAQKEAGTKGRWGDGDGEREKGKREREGKKGTQKVDDTTVSQPILKAVVARHDLGAAGTEFERSLIVSPFKNIFAFPSPF